MCRCCRTYVSIDFGPWSCTLPNARLVCHNCKSHPGGRPEGRGPDSTYETAQIAQTNNDDDVASESGLPSVIWGYILGLCLGILTQMECARVKVGATRPNVHVVHEHIDINFRLSTCMLCRYFNYRLVLASSHCRYMLQCFVNKRSVINYALYSGKLSLTGINNRPSAGII